MHAVFLSAAPAAAVAAPAESSDGAEWLYLVQPEGKHAWPHL